MKASAKKTTQLALNSDGMARSLPQFMSSPNPPRLVSEIKKKNAIMQDSKKLSSIFLLNNKRIRSLTSMFSYGSNNLLLLWQIKRVSSFSRLLENSLKETLRVRTLTHMRRVTNINILFSVK